MALPLCPANTPGRFGSGPIDVLQATVSVLCSANKENVNEAVLATLWEGNLEKNRACVQIQSFLGGEKELYLFSGFVVGVVSQRAPVRCATASLFSAVIGTVPEALISSRVAPALITLASDPDVYVSVFFRLLPQTLSETLQSFDIIVGTFVFL